MVVRISSSSASSTWGLEDGQEMMIYIYHFFVIMEDH